VSSQPFAQGRSGEGRRPPPTGPRPEDIPSTVGRVHLMFAIGALPASCGFWLQSATPGPPTSGDLADLAANIDTFWDVPGIMGVASDSLTHDHTKVVWSDGLGAAVEGESTPGAPGLIAGDAMPANTCAVLSMHDGSHYRGGKGRMYWPGQPNAAAASVSSWSNDFVTTLDAGLNDFLIGVNALTPAWAGTITVGTLHRWLAGVAITPVFRPSSSITTQHRICTQRRRLGPTI